MYERHTAIDDCGPCDPSNVERAGAAVVTAIKDREAENGNVEPATSDYQLISEHVLVAVFCYPRHPHAIDAEIIIRIGWLTVGERENLRVTRQRVGPS